MPRYKRYAPVSHDINTDPEVWEFTTKFGDRSIRTLIEVLIIIDRSENRWRLTGDWSGNLSRRVRQSVANVRRQVLHMVASGWLLVEETAADGSPLVLSATKYWDYHIKRETNKHKDEFQSGNKKSVFRGPPSLPIPSLPLEDPAQGAGTVEKSEKKSRTISSIELLALARRLNLSSPQTQKLCQWVISMTRCLVGEPPERVAAVTRLSLDAFERRVAKLGAIDSVFGYLTTIFDNERTKYMQGTENNGYKTGPIPASISAIMKGIGDAR